MSGTGLGAEGAAARPPRSRRMTAPVVILGLALSALALWLALRGVDLSEVGDALRGASVPLYALGVLAVMASYPLLAMRWRVIAEPLDPPGNRRMLELTLVGAAVNNLLPSRLGEIARAYGLARSTRRPILEAFGTVVVDRVADVLAFSLCLAATLWVEPDATWARWLGIFGLALSAATVAGLVVLGVVLRRGDAAGMAQGRFTRYLVPLLRGLACVRGRAAVWRALLLTAAAWGVWMLGAWLIARSLGLHLSVPELAFMTGVVGLGSAVPSAPGYVGTYDWLASSALVLFGFSKADGLAFAVLLHASWYVPTTLLGSAVMVRRGIGLATVRGLSLRPQARVRT